ncbi:hypothetical protein FHG87_018249 [Trinorchestia longiramus]|nr:hypothetical protein FHG87_018249 [Trinorchestia longiramus]
MEIIKCFLWHHLIHGPVSVRDLGVGDHWSTAQVLRHVGKCPHTPDVLQHHICFLPQRGGLSGGAVRAWGLVIAAINYNGIGRSDPAKSYHRIKRHCSAGGYCRGIISFQLCCSVRTVCWSSFGARRAPCSMDVPANSCVQANMVAFSRIQSIREAPGQHQSSISAASVQHQSSIRAASEQHESRDAEDGGVHPPHRMDLTVAGLGNATMLPQPLLEDGRSSVLEAESSQLSAKEKELQEFYSTYDVWTGIRTAITLALFFLFTVSVILYKSRCKKSRPFEMYPSVEDLPDRPLDYCDYWCNNPIGPGVGLERTTVGRFYEEGAVSMGSAPLPPRGSVGSYASLANSFRVKSLPGSVTAMSWSRLNSYERDDATVMHAPRSGLLRVPGVGLPSTTSCTVSCTASCTDACSASASSHDSQPDAAAHLGVPGARPRPLLQLGGMDWDSGQATAEWLQTIDINVIQPTPNISPCGSVRSVSDQAGSLEHCGLQPFPSTASHRHVDEDGKSVGSDSVFYDGSASSCDDSSSFRSTSRSSRRATQPNLPYVGSDSSIQRNQLLLGLPTTTHLSGSTEKLSIQAPVLSRPGSKTSLQTALSIEDDPKIMSFKVPNVRRTHSATTEVRHSVKVKKSSSPIKRAESETQTVKRSDSSASHRKNSSGSTSSTDEASESVSFHLMVPQLSVDIPSQDVSRASSPSLSPTPPQTPPSKRSLGRGRLGGSEGRAMLRRQLAKDYTQPCQHLPTYPEEEEHPIVTSYDFVTIKPPPGYRDSSPLPPLSTSPLPPLATSPLPHSPSSHAVCSPVPTSPIPYPLSPLCTDQLFNLPMPHPMSPIPPPPSPLYSSKNVSFGYKSPSPSPKLRSSRRTPSPLAVQPGSPLPRCHSPLVRTDPPMAHALAEAREVGNKKLTCDHKQTGNQSSSQVEATKVYRQQSMAAMTPISLDVPELPDVSDVHETSC